MAHRNQIFANRLAQNSDHPTGYQRMDELNHSTSMVDIHLVDNSDSISTAAPVPLCVHVERVVRDYFSALGDEIPTDLYELILRQVELPLLTVVLEQTRGNQTKCAQILGLNRGTLRKKLKTYNLMT